MERFYQDAQELVRAPPPGGIIAELQAKRDGFRLLQRGGIEATNPVTALSCSELIVGKAPLSPQGDKGHSRLRVLGRDQASARKPRHGGNRPKIRTSDEFFATCLDLRLAGTEAQRRA